MRDIVVPSCGDIIATPKGGHVEILDIDLFIYIRRAEDDVIDRRHDINTAASII